MFPSRLTAPIAKKVFICVALLAFWWLGLNAAKTKSFTIDEPYHVIRAFAIRQGQDFRLQLEHTPLCHWLASTFLSAEMAPPLDMLDGWHTGNRHTVTNAPFELWTADEQLMVKLLARIPILLFGLLFISIMALWAKRLGGDLAAIFTVALLASSPNLLAHASLATTDFTAAASFGIALFTLWLYQSERTARNWWIAALGLGIGIAGKMTNLMLLPIWFLVVLSDGEPLFKPKKFYKLIGMYTVAFLCLWGTYRFGWAQLNIFPESWPAIPAGYYLSNFVTAFVHVNVGQASSYLLGEIRYNDGWRTYFLVALATKTQIAFLIAFAIALFAGVYRRTVLVWAPALLVLGIASMSDLNIGLRHVLPVIPLMMLFAGVGCARVYQTVMARASSHSMQLVPTIGYCILFGMLALSVQYTHPNYLSFFNLLAGGPENGHEILLDSNLDWGQDVYFAGEYLDKRTPEYAGVVAHLAAEGTYTLPYELLNVPNTTFSPANPTPGLYVVSMNQLNGIFTLPAEVNMLNRFKTREPLALLNGTMAVFEVDDLDQGEWIAHCDSMDNETVSLFGDMHQLVNAPGAELVSFDCNGEWWLDGENRSGWYVVDQDGYVEVLSGALATLNGPSASSLVFAHEPVGEMAEYYVYYVDTASQNQ
ncbi:MAG: glycosyltransferase family 39 protein [Chloroflexota bacterium]